MHMTLVDPSLLTIFFGYYACRAPEGASGSGRGATELCRLLGEDGTEEAGFALLASPPALVTLFDLWEY